MKPEWKPEISPEEAAKGVVIEVYDPAVHGKATFVLTDEASGFLAAGQGNPKVAHMDVMRVGRPGNP